MNSSLHIAPMMDRTDRHFRYLLRLLSPDAMLYTEMVVAAAVLHGDRDRLLGFDPAEHPLVLQLGGSDPAQLAAAAVAGAARGYDALNLNIGCPSDRVQSGRFGACLMAEPDTVAACVQAMRARVDLPVTVKTRIGIDAQDSYEFLCDFIGRVAAAGCDTFVVHARKALLSGLSPAENRSIPPLRYETVYRLKQDFPDLTVIINGGIRDTPAVLEHLRHVDGVMIGRHAYSDPYWLTEVQAALTGPDRPPPSRLDVLERMVAYAEQEQRRGTRLQHISRHLLGLFAGQPGARAWRRRITEGVSRPGVGPEIFLNGVPA